MSISVLRDKTHTPGEQDLEKVLGKSKSYWDEIKSHLTTEYAPTSEEWGSSGKKYGWYFRIKQKKRTILYLIPGEGFFHSGFVFGEKAVIEAHKRSLPSTVMEMIDQAPRYAEGRGFRLPVKNRKDVAVVKELVSIKLSF